MKQCYNWENNILDFIDINSNRYLLSFKGNKTVVQGKSGTGKTLICTMLTNIIDDDNVILRPYSADNIFIASKKDVDKVFEQSKKLIIIDRAEFILNQQLVTFINQDRINRYLIFSRKPIGLAVSPNYFATLYNNNGCLQLNYEFDEVGWN